MAMAYLKIWVGVGKERAVRDALRGLQDIMRADITTGEQDVIALIQAPDYTALLEAILTRVRSIEGVERTETNLVLD